jgi:hypothetical protein
MSTFVTDLVGKSGVYATHGAGQILRHCKVIGFVAPGKSAIDLIFSLIETREGKGFYNGIVVDWRDVTDRSGVPRYLIITPKLTRGGEISRTGRQIIMSPNMFTFNIYFTPDPE